MICPVCHRSTPASSARCIRCWANRLDFTALNAAESEQYRVLEQDEAERKHRGAVARRRWVRGLAAVAAAVAVWWVYSAYFAARSPLSLPALTARSTESSPEAWPLQGGGTGRARLTAASVDLDAAEVWRVELGAAPSAVIVADEQHLYVSLTDGRLAAISVTTGEIVWERTYDQFILISPAVAGDLLYVIAGRRPQPIRLIAIEVSSGDVRWETDIGSQAYGAPLVDRGTVYIFGESEFMGFAAESGERLWRRGIDTGWSIVDRPFVSPVLSDDYVAVATDVRVLVFDRTTGEQTYWWDHASFPEYLSMHPDGIIYSVSHRFVAGIDATSRRPWWDGVRRAWTQFWIWGMAPAVPSPPHEWLRNSVGSNVLPLAVDDARVYIAGRAGEVRAVDRLAGDVEWEGTVGALRDGPIRAANGLLFGSGQSLLLLDAESGAELGRRELEGVAVLQVIPTSQGVYVAGDGGTLLALR